jgi:hypothetical protein
LVSEVIGKNTFGVSENMVLRGTFGPKREIVLSSGAERPGRKVDHSPPLVPKLRMSGSIPLFPYTRILLGQSKLEL